MFEEPNTWALVLAAGEGSRLRALTTAPSGTAIPKQFCCLHQGPSLLQEALLRARAVAEESHICAVVAEEHRRWWKGSLQSLPAENVIVQPENRGTANGILLPLLHILFRDPDARLVILPSDHHVGQEPVLASSLRDAIEQLDWRLHETLLLGIQPEEADPELGYILPGGSDGRGALTIRRFVEKPTAALARDLIGAGGLWNAFIVVSTALALLSLYRQRVPEIAQAMYAAVKRDREEGSDAGAVAELYETLPIIDFSRDIIMGQESNLRALPMRPCGWSDLGTPKRVSEALRRAAPPEVACERAEIGFLSLAEQHERIHAARVASRAH